METRTDHTFVLSAHDTLKVMTHQSARCVSLHISSITPQQVGFSLQFLPEHLEIVRQLSAQLANLDAALLWNTITKEEYAEDESLPA